MNTSTLGLVVASVCTMAVGCSQTPKNETVTTDSSYSSSEKTMAGPATGAGAERTRHVAKVAEIDFSRGGTKLSPSGKKELAAIVKDARSVGKIQEVKILAWADRDYAVAGREAPSSDVKLADARAKEVQNYIRDSLKVTEIDSHNMAKQPGAMSRLFKTDDYELKTGRYDKEGTLFKPEPSPQKAVVLVEIEENM